MMISIEEYKQYENEDKRVQEYNENGYALCWHCKRAIHIEENNVSMAHSHGMGISQTYHFWFHLSCFSEIAGPDYMMDIPKK